MNITRTALSNPTAVVSAVLLVLLFGLLSLSRLPVQMIPTIERPFIQINTGWRAAAPDEVEAEILEQQEDVLRGLQGLEKLEATASRGSASISMRFAVGTNLERALLDVLNRLNRVPSYPADASEPQITAGGGGDENSIAWYALGPADGSERSMGGYQDFVNDVIAPRIERVQGIAQSNNYGGRQSELRITFDPYQAAALGIELPAVIGSVGNSTDVSAGFQDVGRRQYTVRFAGRYAVDEFLNVLLPTRDGGQVRLREVASVGKTLVDKSGVLSVAGRQAIAINAQPEPGVNVLQVMTRLKAAVAELNEGPLARQGLAMTLVYDETDYIKDSIAMLRNNLLLGIALAVGILWVFLRLVRATLVVGIAIPVSLFVAFSALYVSGRTINIISLAGLAFAMGMVLDAAIVVLENIVRLRESGLRGPKAAARGASEVWPALLASTATTVAIFLPILFMQDVAGQLFADLAFAIAVAVVTSLVIAVTIVPTASIVWLKGQFRSDSKAAFWQSGADRIMRLTDTRARRAGWIIGLSVVAIGLTVLLKPQADYLPEGRQNYLFGFILAPPGQSVDAAENEFANVVNARLRPYLAGDQSPAIRSYFMGVFGRGGFFGMRARNPDDVDALMGVMNGQVLRGFPDTMAFASRAPIFGRLGGGRGIEVNVQSRDIDAMLRAGGVGMAAIARALPGAQARPLPGLELAQPELRLVPDDVRITEVGWTRAQVASVTRALGDGVFVGDYFDGDRQLDIILRSEAWPTPEDLAAIPLATPTGTVPLGDLVRLERTAGPDQIRRVDRRRTITLSVTPPGDMSLEEAINILQTEVDPAIRAELPADGDIAYYGSADNLKTALTNMGYSLILAVTILYLLISALFRSFRDALLVILALPLAIVGGVAALRLTDVALRSAKAGIQPMDLLTMIGFITLLGLVVNNAILLVHQTRESEREGKSRRASVHYAVRVRLRPIFMSTLTTLFGMLPLLLIPGPGTELYRGLAAVIVGGMSVSTLFTLVLLPSLLRLGEDKPAHQGTPDPETTAYA
ncbi:MAG: efflux RND transporter permease subunit [Pseudomonadota bacterium]